MKVLVVAITCSVASGFGHMGDDEPQEIDRWMVGLKNKFPASWAGGSSLPMDTPSFNPITGTATMTDAVSDSTAFFAFWRFKEYDDGTCKFDFWFYLGGLISAALGAPPEFSYPDAINTPPAEIWEKFHGNIVRDVVSALSQNFTMLEIVKDGTACTVEDYGEYKDFVVDHQSWTLRDYAASNFNHGDFLYLDEWGESVDKMVAVQRRYQTEPYTVDLQKPAYITFLLTSGRYITDHYTTWFFSGNGTYGGNGGAMGLGGQETCDPTLEAAYLDGTPY